VQRLREYDVVTVSLPTDDAKLRNGCFECDVVAILNDTAALEPRDPSDVMWLPERVEGAFMSFRRGRELVGLKGILVMKDDAGDLRFTVSDGVQRRRRTSSRLDITAPITISLPATGAQVSGVTVNIGGDGILAEADLAAAPGEEVEVLLSLPGFEDAIEAVATVVRHSEGLIALELNRARHDLRHRLGMFVLEHNRTALRQSRGTSVQADF
jgi:hypothetical protein